MTQDRTECISNPFYQWSTGTGLFFIPPLLFTRHISSKPNRTISGAGQEQGVFLLASVFAKEQESWESVVGAAPLHLTLRYLHSGDINVKIFG